MSTQPFLKEKDPEAGGDATPLYPSMDESPELRWSFIRKVYSIVAVQLLFTIAVGLIVVSVSPVTDFLTGTTAGLIVVLSLAVVVIVALLPLLCFYERHPVNYILLGIFTACLSILIGLSCAYTSGEVILEALILTVVAVASLTLYTFWAVKRGHDFSFLGLFLFAVVIIFIVFSIITIFYPVGAIYDMVYGVVSSIIFCGYIIWDTYVLIKRHSYDQYILAALSLYVDIVRLFGALVRAFGGTRSST